MKNRTSILNLILPVPDFEHKGAKNLLVFPTIHTSIPKIETAYSDHIPMVLLTF